MKVRGREEVWIHTHFLTDCTRLSESRMREIVRAMTPFLREVGIAFGLHFTQTQHERTCRIVLECIPFAKTLDHLEQQLREIVRDIPSRPPVTKVTHEERPETPLTARG